MHGRKPPCGQLQCQQIRCLKRSMDNPRPFSPAASGKPSSGPQGTRFFAQEDLRQLASEAGQASEARASVHKPVLESISPELGGRRFSVHPGRQTIGRLASNDIVVSGPSVSSAHAWIMNQQGRCVIMNTLSTNGTFVNDKRVHQATLKHGDRIDVEAVATDTRDNGEAIHAVLGFTAVSYPISRGSAAMYYPEGNRLVGLDHYDLKSGTPAYKSIPVSIRAARGSVARG